MIHFEQFRDVTLLHMENEETLVISCDSIGGIGEKKEDRVQAPPEVVGYYGARVALMEVIALRAKPLALINTLSVEMENYGERILAGIEKAVRELPRDVVMPVTGSSEENFPMVQTALGVTVIGTLEKKADLPPKTDGGESLFLVGLPKVGEGVLADEGEVLSMEDLYHLINHRGVKDILPIGSKGIAHELEVLGEEGGKVDRETHREIDFFQSGGPSTSALVLMKETGVKELRSILKAPITKL